jgi:hypothetical protein
MYPFDVVKVGRALMERGEERKKRRSNSGLSLLCSALLYAVSSGVIASPRSRLGLHSIPLSLSLSLITDTHTQRERERWGLGERATEAVLPHTHTAHVISLLSLSAPLSAPQTRLQRIHPDPKAYYRGVAHCFRSMVRKEGPSSLFRGMNVVVLGAGPAHALYFSAYEKCKSALGTEADKPVNTAIAAFCATFAHDSFMNPIEGPSWCALSLVLFL